MNNLTRGKLCDDTSHDNVFHFFYCSSSEDPNVMKSNFIEIERVCKERKEQEKPVYRITIPAGEISRIFIHEGEAIQMTKGWLRGIRADCKAGMSRLDRVSTPLFINGLMKTGRY